HRRKGRKRVSIIDWVIVATALVIALLLPAGYFSVKYGALAAAVHTEAEFKASTISQLIASTPELWRFQEHRLQELIQRHVGGQKVAATRILDQDGMEVVALSQPLGFATLTRSAGLFDSGVQVGRIEVSRSLYDLYLNTAGVLLLGALLGTVVFTLLRMLRRRTKRLNEALFQEKERAEVTLHSIGDAVITINENEIIDYLNPAAAKLTGWTLAEAQSRPVHEVLRLIDEQTMEAVADPLQSKITSDAERSFGAQIALLRRDGSSIAIEENAAPIRNRKGHVIGGVIVFHDVSAARSMAQRLTWQATHDSLTGLINRREFERLTEAAIATTQNADKQHVVCYLDLDQFKIINDTCGHPAGDELL
ncbi:MAG: diguanylate cyclase, partial [Candidatus Competibacteraceae bacterium]|nr:diguanylate cyclase [Candidatus Competibacteraceae bacterium]